MLKMLGRRFVLTAAAGPREFAEAQRANQLALRQYSWKSRTELKVNGESKQVRLEQVRFDLDGRLQKTVIGGDPVRERGRALVRQDLRAR